MKIAKVALSRQITLVSGRYMELFERDGDLKEGPHGVTVTTEHFTRLIPWHTIESVEYARTK